MTAPLRRNGRKIDELRALKISYDGLARVDGSATFGFGDTAALASVSGPIEVRLAAELPSKATFEVLVRPLSNVPATESKSLAATMRSSLEPSLILTKNPRTLVQLVIQSLSSPRMLLWKDSLSAAMVNASSVAFLKASSVPMRGVVTAVAVGQLPDGRLVVDPSEDESESLKAGGSFAFMFADELGLMNSNSDCVWSSWKSTSGSYGENELFEARELARSGAKAVYGAMKRNIEQMNGAADSRVPPTHDAKVEEDAEHGEEQSDEDNKMEI
ncbi:exosome component Rrp46 [Flammula alnicola]|nr:exosome component Rrp46 [Flammula alnicola]